MRIPVPRSSFRYSTTPGQRVANIRSKGDRSIHFSIVRLTVATGYPERRAVSASSRSPSIVRAASFELRQLRTDRFAVVHFAAVRANGGMTTKPGTSPQRHQDGVHIRATRRLHRALQSRLAVERSVDVEDTGGNARTIAPGQRHPAPECAGVGPVGKKESIPLANNLEARAASATDPPYRPC